MVINSVADASSIIPVAEKSSNPKYSPRKRSIRLT